MISVNVTMIHMIMFRMQVIDLARNGKEVSEPKKYRNHEYKEVILATQISILKFR